MALVSTAAVTAVPAAAAERKLNMTATVRALASDDIFLVGRDGGSLLGEGVARVQLSSRDERQTLAADLSLGARGYTNDRFKSETFGSGRLSGSWAASERLSASGELQFSRERTSELQNEVAAAADPQRQVTSLGGGFRLNFRRSETMTLNTLVDFRRQSFGRPDVLAPGVELRSFSSFATGFGVGMRLSERLTVGADSRVSLDRYSSGGTSVRVGGSGRADLALSDTTRVSGAIGLDHSLRSAEGQEGRTGLTGNLSLCRNWLHRNGCVVASLSRDASGLGNSQRFTAGANYSWQIARATFLSAESSYTTTTGALSGRRLSFFDANVNGSHRIGRHLSLGLTAGYRRRTGLVQADGAILGFNLSWTTEAMPS